MLFNVRLECYRLLVESLDVVGGDPVTELSDFDGLL